MRQQILRRLFRECLKRSYRETDTGASWDFSRRFPERATTTL